MDFSTSEQLIHTCHRRDESDLRLLHFNDVYNLNPSSSDPVGGIARFQTLCNYYHQTTAFPGQPSLVALFSGDAFNPSLESAVTKGSHMVPVLNHIGTACAVVGNHDLDFGVAQFRHLARQCNFPWLIANVLDPDLGEDVPLGNAEKTALLTASNGVKLGIIGLVEREWLETINSLPPNLIYKSASATAQLLVPELRKQGANIIIALSHAREPNDHKLAEKTPPGLIDLILGGHDHFYKHSIINKTHILRSGTDFKQFSHIKAWRSRDEIGRWDFEIVRQDVLRSVPEDPRAAAIVADISSGMKRRLEKPVGYTAAPLDARFTTVRLRESNIGNFVCDLMRLYYGADCTLMAAGTIRGDQVYPPGVLRAKDIMTCFPFEDPVVVLRLSGKSILAAVENSVSLYPALEGRFPQVSNIIFKFDPKAEAGSRVKSILIGGMQLEMEKRYVLATRDYMARGKDGFQSLLGKEDGGEAEEVVSEENGILISMLLRQYFLSLKVLGRWGKRGKSMGSHFEKNVHTGLHQCHPLKAPRSAENTGRFATSTYPGRDEDFDSQGNSAEEDEISWGDVKGRKRNVSQSHKRERELVIMRKVIRKWWRLTGLPGHPHLDTGEEEFSVDWTQGITPRVEGRIEILST